MLKYNFAAIDGLCNDMTARVGQLAGYADTLQNDISQLGASWEGGTSEAMRNAFTSLHKNIASLSEVIGDVRRAVETGNSDMGATDSYLSTHWHPEAAV